MDNEIDSVGPVEERSEWVWCGGFPLKEISKGRRACRKGWRNRGDNKDMLAVVVCDSPKGPRLELQHETENDVKVVENFNNVEDMLATDWFIEEDLYSCEPIENQLIPEDKIPEIIDALL